MSTCKDGCTVTIDTLVSEGYIDDIKDSYNGDNNLQGEVSISKINNKFTYNFSRITNFAYSSNIVTYSIPKTGNYIIEAAGAEGTTGNNYSYTGDSLNGGKGATISSTFSLNKGDVLYIVVGGQGSVTDATAIDGTSGAGGGGSFVFKKIPSITNSKYQITKNSEYLEVLLVAAGGGGSTDNSYRSKYNGTLSSGADGIGATWISPGGAAYSTITKSDTVSSSASNVLGISQFITYNSVGSYYTRNSGVCRGGFGGGGCADDNPSYGGGWSTGTSYAATSFSSGVNTAGTTGSRSGNGYVKITEG